MKYNFSLYKDTYGQSSNDNYEKEYAIVVWYLKLWRFCFILVKQFYYYQSKIKKNLSCAFNCSDTTVWCKNISHTHTHKNPNEMILYKVHIDWSINWSETSHEILPTKKNKTSALKYQSNFFLVVYIQTRHFIYFVSTLSIIIEKKRLMCHP